MQITTYGSQDLFLTGNPEITFFKVVYRRHTLFSMESIELFFDDINGFGKTGSVIIPKIGDLIHKTYVKVVLPKIALPRALSTPIYTINLETANIHFKAVETFMKVNIQAYRNGIDQYISTNTIPETVLDAINASFGVFNFTGNIKNDFINALFGTSFNYSKISIQDIIKPFFDETNIILPTVTKEDIKFSIDIALKNSIDVFEYFYEQLKLYQNLSADEINPLAKTAWIKKLGHFIINYVSISIGGYEIDKHYGEWINIWYELTSNKFMDTIYNKMIGNISELTEASRKEKQQYTLYIPLQFWFCRFSGLAIPLVSLQFHDILITVKFQKFSKCFYMDELTNEQKDDPVLRQNTIDQLGISNLDDYLENNNLDIIPSLLVDYIYLDSSERKKFAQSSHEYLIEQLNINEVGIVNSMLTQYTLDFNHACKELIWIAQDQSYVEYIDGFSNLQYDNYSSNIGTSDNLIEINPLEFTSLLFNGYSRFDKLPSEYFNLIQPYEMHSNIPPEGINVYSFALHPEEYQPSGTCNFGRISRSVINFYFNEFFYEKGINYNVRIYATNYNVLRFASGLAAISIV